MKIEDNKKCIIDFRMRKVEKEYLKSLGYDLIENKYNFNVYDEIASHIDIFYLKLLDKIIVSKCMAEIMLDKLNNVNHEVGECNVEDKYPFDIPYNVCIIGNRAIHNFKYTDKKVLKLLDELKYTKINVEQGYTKCSIAVIDDNSCITSDIGIAKILLDYNIDVLLVNETDISLLKRTNNNITNENRMFFEKSEMNGFIGGAMTRIDNKIVIFGDIDNFVNSIKIRQFIEKKGLEIIDFKGLDIIDYGGIITI